MPPNSEALNRKAPRSGWYAINLDWKSQLADSKEMKCFELLEAFRTLMPVLTVR